MSQCNFNPVWFAWTQLMTYSTENSQSSGHKAHFRSFWRGNESISYKHVPLRNWIGIVSFKHTLIHLATCRPCFTPVLFIPFFLNVPYQLTLLNLRLIVFGLTPFGRLRSSRLTPCFWEGYNILFTPTYSWTQLGRKTRLWCSYNDISNSVKT
jgi:hypothetical protein